MVTQVDERKGLVKTYWADIRERVAKVEPAFTKIVDALTPDKTFPIYLAYYPYGAMTGDTESPFIPTPDGGNYRLSDPTAPKDVIKHLGYGKNSFPLGMLLEKELEYYIDAKDEKITLPWLVYTPGTIFPLARVLSKSNNRIYAPNGVLTTTSGARSVFMLPSIGCFTNHVNLQRDFNIKSSAPKSLYEHWNIFKEIINSKKIDCDWRSCLLLFSEKWLNKLINDPAWVHLKLYLHELGWRATEYRRNHFYHDINFAGIQKKRNLKPNPYLADTAKHLLMTALGAAPGFIPANNNDALPLDILQKAFVESYGMKKYFPTVLKPVKYIFENDKYPIYYSLQNPATHMFSPNSREAASTLFEMRELEHITRTFIEELAKDSNICSDTIINKIAKEIDFKFYHNKSDQHQVVLPSTEIIRFDKRFNTKHKAPKAEFASDGAFVRGCVSLQRKI